MRRILIPTDFSDHAERALEYGVALAELFEAELELLHAVFVGPPWVGEGASLPPDLLERATGLAREQLENLAEPLRGRGLSVSTKVAQEHPAVAIREVAEAAEADLIALGTHGRTGLSHLLLGSVAERTARLAKCPVMTVHAEVPSPPKPIRRILVPTDFSPDARAGLGWARELAGRSGATLVLVHAIVPPLAVGTEELYIDDRLQRKLEEEARENLQALAASSGDAQVELLHGHPDIVALEAAERVGADLIVIGSRGRAGLAHFFLGSNAERIIRRAQIPVVTLKE